MNAPKMVTLTLYEHRAEAASILVSLDGDEKATKWLPKSQIEIAPERVDAPPQRGQKLTLTRIMVRLPDWLARTKGLVAAAADGQGRLL